MPISEHEYLFVRTLGELRDQLHTRPSDDYKHATLAALLRKLIVDGGSSLVDLANREVRLQIRFTLYHDPWPQSEPGTYVLSIVRVAPPREAPPDKLRVVTREDLLRHIVEVNGDVEVTVKDLILYGANVRGGIHAGAPRGAAQETLLAGREPYGTDASSLNLLPLSQIATVVGLGLSPLARAIIAKK